jgi:hypothetical protein
MQQPESIAYEMHLNRVEEYIKLKKEYDELLNLYNKEKEKNNSISIQYEKVVDKLEALEQIEKEHKEENGRLRKELDKKENTINLMAEQLTTPVHSKKWVIDYFTNKVEEDIKE